MIPSSGKPTPEPHQQTMPASENNCRSREIDSRGVCKVCEGGGGGGGREGASAFGKPTPELHRQSLPQGDDKHGRGWSRVFAVPFFAGLQFSAVKIACRDLGPIRLWQTKPGAASAVPHGEMSSRENVVGGTFSTLLVRDGRGPSIVRYPFVRDGLSLVLVRYP